MSSIMIDSARLHARTITLTCSLSLLASFFQTSCKTEEQKAAPTQRAAEKAAIATDSTPLSHDEEPPPPPPTGRPVVAYRDGKADEMREPQAKAAGLSVIDLSNYWVPYIFSERDSDDEERKPNEFRPIFRKLANDWHYESRTRAAAREIVERQLRRSRRNRIWRYRQEGVSDEEIQKIMKISASDIKSIMGNPASEENKSEKTKGKSKDTSDTSPSPNADGETSQTADDDEFEGGLGEADNFLEVYGIPPSLSVLRKRAMEEIDLPCLEQIDFDLIRSFGEFLSYKSNKRARDDSRKGRRAVRKLEKEMAKLKVGSFDELRAHPKGKRLKVFIEQAIQYTAVSEVQELLVCEGFYKKGDEKDYWKGGLDWKTHQALLKFEHKNRVFGWGFLGKNTRAAIGKSAKERLFDAFVRVLQERIIDATHIIEDGSAVGPDGTPATFKDTDGSKKPVPNLVAEYTAAALHHMDLKTPDKVVAFLKAHADTTLDTLFVALPLPALPPYHNKIMELKAVIDRGDVWYDYPYTEDGKHRTFPRKKMPMTTLFVVWNGQEIPIVSMNTTIGGWRTELAPDGHEYYKYKNSDVGPRVWKDIVAGPVWLPPNTTPIKDLLKEVRYRGRRLKVPNYDEFGPWYASAYGLVAGFHVRPVERKKGTSYFDNGIRSHGSMDYNSILRRFSHGCHRLYNHLAIRLFDFMLRHSEFERVGQIPAGYSRSVLLEPEEGEEGEAETYVINIQSKGYKYELKKPVPVNVLPGNIRGRQKTPIETYMPKPEETYGADAQFLPEGYLEKQNADAGVEELSLGSAVKTGTSTTSTTPVTQ